MIRHTTDLGAVMQVAEVEPVQGSLIETLAQAYGDFPGLVDFYLTEGGVLCRQGETLILAGRSCDLAELLSFGQMLGVRELTCVEGAVSGAAGADTALEHRQILVHTGALRTRSRWQAEVALSFSRVFDLIKVGSAPNFDRADRAAFITDVGRRASLGLAKIVTVRDAATAGIYASGCGHAVIGCVATLPEQRGLGFAGAAVTACVEQALQRGLTPVVIAQDDSVVNFYIKLGFRPRGVHLTYLFYT